MSPDTADRLASVAGALVEAVCVVGIAVGMGWLFYGDPARIPPLYLAVFLFIQVAFGAYRRSRLRYEIHTHITVIRRWLNRDCAHRVPAAAIAHSDYVARHDTPDATPRGEPNDARRSAGRARPDAGPASALRGAPRGQAIAGYAPGVASGPATAEHPSGAPLPVDGTLFGMTTPLRASPAEGSPRSALPLRGRVVEPSAGVRERVPGLRSPG